MTYRILTYDEIDRAEWSRLVRESRTGTWFQTPEAYEFFASMPDLFRPFVVAVANNPSLSEAQHSSTPSLHEQVLRAVCSGYVTVEKNPIKQFFTRRAIIIGGPALADDASSEEVTALLEAVKKKAGQKVASLRLPPKGKRATAQKPANRESFLSGLSSLLLGRDGVGSSPIYIETRNFNSYERWKSAFEKAGFEYQPHLNFHVDCTDQKAMWIRMSETRRKQIRRAQRVNVTISEAQSEKEICEWYAILKRMYQAKVKTPLFPVSFFLEAYRQGAATYLMVRYEGKIIGGSMIVVKKPTSDNVLLTATGSPIEQSSSPVKGREEGLGTGPTFASVWGAHTADSTQYDLLKENARANRKNPTEAESVMWDMLKTNNLGLHFRRQHVILDYIADFICLEKGLVIEIDGGYHTNPEQKDYDDRRTAHLQQLGYTELRFTNEELLVNPEEVAAKIKAVATKLPSFQGRGGVRLGTVYEWFECGRDVEYEKQYPSVMATYAGMAYAAEHGIARCDFMGAGVPGVPYGVRDFKERFGGKMVEHGRFLYIAKPILYRIGALGVKIMKGL